MGDLEKYRKLQAQRKEAYAKYAKSPKGIKARDKALKAYHKRIKANNEDEGFRKHASPAEKAYEGRNE